jgi:hypothetical protein
VPDFDDPNEREFERVVPLRPKCARSAARRIGKPPPRGWLLGNVFCRGFVSSLYGDGAVGKTALRYAQAMALATGREITGEHVFHRSKVLIVSLEDDDDELDRRILAIQLHHNISPDDFDGWLFVWCPGNRGGKLIEMDQKGHMVPGNLRAALEDEIRRNNITLVILDPFVKTHSVDENSNMEIDAVVQILTAIASDFKIAVDVPHHVAKGALEPGNAQKGRGASALTNAVRMAYTLTAMSPEEATVFSVIDSERYQYVRHDRAKVNNAKRTGPTKWYRLIGVPLENGTPEYPNGDEVQTVEPWLPPGVWDGTNADILEAILIRIDGGLPDGTFYSAHNRANTRAAWLAVQAVAPEISEGQARAMVKSWIKTQHLEEFEYRDQTARRMRTGLRKSGSLIGAP